jgi:hypothetical protein
MNQLSIPNRVLRGEAERAALSLYRLKCEVERKYVKDSAGLSWVSKHLNQVSLFLDHIDRPLATATKLEETMSLRGLNGFNSDTVWKRLDVLIPLYLELLEAEGKAIPFEKRRVIAKLVPALAIDDDEPFIERRKQG